MSKRLLDRTQLTRTLAERCFNWVLQASQQAEGEDRRARLEAHGVGLVGYALERGLQGGRGEDHAVLASRNVKHSTVCRYARFTFTELCVHRVLAKGQHRTKTHLWRWLYTHDAQYDDMRGLLDSVEHTTTTDAVLAAADVLEEHQRDDLAWCLRVLANVADDTITLEHAYPMPDQHGAWPQYDTPAQAVADLRAHAGRATRLGHTDQARRLLLAADDIASQCNG